MSYGGEMVCPDWVMTNNAPCPFNLGVDCVKREKCRSCGWNPQNDELRTKRVRKALEGRRLWLDSRED